MLNTLILVCAMILLPYRVVKKNGANAEYPANAGEEPIGHSGAETSAIGESALIYTDNDEMAHRAKLAGVVSAGDYLVAGDGGDGRLIAWGDSAVAAGSRWVVARAMRDGVADDECPVQWFERPFKVT